MGTGRAFVGNLAFGNQYGHNKRVLTSTVLLTNRQLKGGQRGVIFCKCGRFKLLRLLRSANMSQPPENKKNPLYMKI